MLDTCTRSAVQPGPSPSLLMLFVGSSYTKAFIVMFANLPLVPVQVCASCVFAVHFSYPKVRKTWTCFMSGSPAHVKVAGVVSGASRLFFPHGHPAACAMCVEKTFLFPSD